METKYGIAKLSYAIIDTNGTDLVEGIEVILDGELIGQLFDIEFDCISELSIKEIETILEKFI